MPKYTTLTGLTLSPDVVALNPQLAELSAKAKKRNKYGAVRVRLDNGLNFASKAEWRRYGELRLLEMDGQLTELVLQPKYKLPGGIKYIGDFQYLQDGRVICEEVKGFETASWRIKKKLFLETYPDINLVIIKA